MQIVKLCEYPKHRLSAESAPSIGTLRRDAAKGRLPGAFRLTDGGAWYVDLDTHDKVIKERIEENMVATPANDESHKNPAVNDDDDAVVLEILAGAR
ncbi:MAG: hypothetical protein ACJA1I_000558 [Zhongshania marina]|jgi:hypothetical protein